MCLGRYIVLTSRLGNGVPWSCRLVVFWSPIEIGVLIRMIKCLQSWHLWWHRHIFLMNCKIDVVVACGAGVMTRLSLGIYWKLHHHFIMCRLRKWGSRSQAIYQHLSLIYSWPLSSELLLTASKYRSEIIAPFKLEISACAVYLEGPRCSKSVIFSLTAITLFFVCFFQTKFFRSFIFTAQHFGNKVCVGSCFHCSHKARICTEGLWHHPTEGPEGQ